MSLPHYRFALSLAHSSLSLALSTLSLKQSLSLSFGNHVFRTNLEPRLIPLLGNQCFVIAAVSCLWPAVTRITPLGQSRQQTS